MQGVRSNISCSGCKRRKKGCDFRRPSCSRCLHLGTTCRYELRQYQFVEAVNHNRSSPPRDLGTPLAVIWPVVTGSPLAQTDTWLQVDEAFWAIYLPAGRLDTSWIEAARKLSQQDNSLEQVFRALAFTGLGWWRDDAALVRRGLAIYAQVLRTINTALEDPIQAQSDATLAACRILSLFEMFRRCPGLPSGDSQALAWRRHAEGTYQLIRMRGKAQHMSDPGMVLYDGVRFAAAVQGLTRRCPNTFTELGWSLTRSENLRDQLLDIACRVPSLLQHADRLLAEDPSRSVLTHEASNLMQVHLELILELLTFEKRILVFSTHGNDSGLLSRCTSGDYSFLYIITQYWSVCISVFSSALLLRSIPSARDVFEASGLSAWVNPTQCAVNIAQVASRFFEPGAGLWSAQASIFPIGAALMHFAVGGTGSIHAKALLTQMRSTKTGMIVLDFLMSMRAQAKR